MYSIYITEHSSARISPYYPITLSPYYCDTMITLHVTPESRSPPLPRDVSLYYGPTPSSLSTRVGCP